MTALITATLLLLVVGALAASRARHNWPAQLRFILSLNAGSSRDELPAALALSEVVLGGRRFHPASRFVDVVRVDRPGEVEELLLDEPLGERSELVAAWQALQTPLLYVCDRSGGAALHGPTECLVGHVTDAPALLTSRVDERRARLRTPVSGKRFRRRATTPASRARRQCKPA